MLSRLFDRWTKSKTLTKNELAILRLLLPAGNSYAERLYSQATNAPYIERKLVANDGYEAVIPYVLDDSMLIECDENHDSPSILITTPNGTVLSFTSTILRGGFLRGLKGQTSSGQSWQKEWIADLSNVRLPSEVDTWIPEPMPSSVHDSIITLLLQWAGLERKSAQDYDAVRMAVPATVGQIQVCESRLKIRLGEQYRELLLISDGFGICRGRPYEFLGSTDIDFVTGGRDWLCLTPLYEEGCVAIRCVEGIATNECSLLACDGTTTSIGDIKQHVRDSLIWEDTTM
jgi:hypothetical protein